MASWIEQRKGKISASNAAAILGLSPYKTPLDAWLDIKGLRPQSEQTAAMAMGHIMEPVIADLYAKQNGVELERPSLMTHPDLSWLVGEPDRLIKGVKKGLEIKNVGRYMAKDWGEEEGSDQVPQHYIIQVALYMSITAYPVFDVAASIGGEYPKIYTLNQDEDLEATVLERLEDWYKKYILGNQEPPFDGSKAYANYLVSKFPRNEKPLKQADATADVFIHRLQGAKEIIASMEDEELTIINHLKAFIGDSEGVEGQSGRITWRAAKDSIVTDWEGMAKDLLKHTIIDNDRIERIIKDWSSMKAGSRRFLTNF